MDEQGNIYRVNQNNYTATLGNTVPYEGLEIQYDMGFGSINATIATLSLLFSFVTILQQLNNCP
jgi:hypothetical protein